ncbi:MAG: YeiH family protein [Bacillota bacterium]
MSELAEVKKGFGHWPRVLGGVAFTAAIAAAGIQAAKLPVLSRLGAMILAILMAVTYRQVAGYPEGLRSGIQLTARTGLRLAIVLFGFRLNLATVLNEGLELLVRDLGTVIGAIALTMLIAKWLKADENISLLVSVGTGVCGAAAIAAVSPILRAKEDDTAVSVGMIALTGTAFTIVYSLLRPLLPLSAVQYGTWAGVSLHEIAHVAAAASPGGSDALAVALLAKLGRVLLLIPLCFLLMYFMRQRNNVSEGTKGQAKVEFPWFLIGFIGCSVLGSYTQISPALHTTLTNVSSYMLTAAMVGLGLNVSLKALSGGRLAKPFLAMLATSVILSVVTYLTIV